MKKFLAVCLSRIPSPVLLLGAIQEVIAVLPAIINGLSYPVLYFVLWQGYVVPGQGVFHRPLRLLTPAQSALFPVGDCSPSFEKLPKRSASRSIGVSCGVVGGVLVLREAQVVGDVRAGIQQGLNLVHPVLGDMIERRAKCEALALEPACGLHGRNACMVAVPSEVLEQLVCCLPTAARSVWLIEIPPGAFATATASVGHQMVELHVC
ncbi:hypothetical protein ACFYZB_26775 [Streptomyces sp. NPDC001852]|uniref:hypothetical protein n=1 Tax=Streptomyces sp. NPDC001852 TaxID=3364619 RepID=UPI00368070D4